MWTNEAAGSVPDCLFSFRSRPIIEYRKPIRFLTKEVLASPSALLAIISAAPPEIVSEPPADDQASTAGVKRGAVSNERVDTVTKSEATRRAASDQNWTVFLLETVP